MELLFCNLPLFLSILKLIKNRRKGITIPESNTNCVTALISIIVALATKLWARNQSVATNVLMLRRQPGYVNVGNMRISRTQSVFTLF